MLQYCCKVFFMLYIIIQLSNNSINARSVLPSIAQENGTTEAVHARKCLPGISQEYGTTEVLDASNFLHGISQANGITEVVNASNLLPDQNFESFPRSCYDLRKLGGVCKNKDNMIIESDEVSDVKEIFELTFNDTKYLPARALFGFSIGILVLDDPDITVHEDVFDGIVHLTSFFVEQSNIKTIPDFRIVEDTIRSIWFTSSPLILLEGKNLQNLTRIKYLTFKRTSIHFIHPDVFKGTENVIELDLSENELTVIPPNLLDPMKKLEIFSVSDNYLYHVDNVFSITHPQVIYLEYNSITDVESVLHFDMKNVETLDISDNPIKSISENTFNLKIPHVRILSLSECELQNFSSEYFIDLEDLEILHLDYNLIEEDYDVCAENFTNEVFERFSGGFSILKLESFYLTGNKLRSLRKILKFKIIRNLYVSDNQIQYLSDEDFRFVRRTEHLELQENQIRRIDSDTFKPIRTRLEFLDLTSNLIISLNGSISYLSQLIKLHLENNSIQSFARDEFTGCNELSELYLQHNRIKTLWQFQQLPNLQHLNIIHNDIEVIRADQVSKSLKFIYLAGNTLQCDCRLQPFLLRLHTEDSFITDIDICTHYANTNSNCPGMCSCGCTNLGDDHFMAVDCSSKSLSVVPQFLKDGFTVVGGNKTITSTGHGLLVMKQNIHPSFDLEDEVLGINLENNSLESLEGIQLPRNLIQLYLANNKLRRLPDSILENQVDLEDVSLSGNPWICDCDALNFKRWLTSSLRLGTIQDVDNVRCGRSGRGESTLNGKVIWSLTDHELCPNDFLVSASIGVVTVIILCFASTFMYRKYEFDIKVLLHSRGFTFVKEKDFGYDKMFDAFLSFSYQDDAFVIDEIISVIEERDPNIHLCVHYRHFRAGEYINDNIIWAVKNSKRTVIILSKNFLNSEWCLMEFQTANTQALEDKVHRIIVIKVGDLPNEIDPAIKADLDSTTYLTWGEKDFWKKLLYILPTGCSFRNQLQDV